MNPYDGDNFINTTSPPGSYADGNIYFGVVAPGATPTVTVAGDNWVYTDFSWSDAHYVADRTTTFAFDTFIYNESISTGYNETKGGYMVLDTLMNAASAGSYANFEGADYATISITGDQDMFDDDSIWAFVFDWIDNDPNNGIPDYYNETLDTGDELTRWQYAGGTGNVLKIDLAYPGGLSNLFPNVPIIMVHDDNIWSWPFTTGNTLDVTVQTWTLADDANVVVTENAGTADVTLTVAVGTDYGIHQGFVIATNATDASMVYKLPYVYSVYATYDTAGTVMEIAEGIGDVQTPYEHGTVTAGSEGGFSADHLSFVVNLTDATVNYLSARINWTNAGTELDVAIVDMTGFELAHSGDAGAKLTVDSSLALANVTGATGMYIIYTSTVALEGGVPEDFTLSVVGLAAIDDATLALSWYSRDTPSKTVLSPGDSAAGDHVILNATWTDGVNPGMPELSITSIELKILAGGVTDETVAAVATGDPDAQLSGSVITPTEWSFVTTHAIESGEFVKITVDFDGGDGDSASWWSDMPMEERTYSNRIATHQSMASGNHPEYGTFTAGQSGSIDVGCLDYGGDSTEFHVIVDTRAGLEPDRVFAKTFEIDTYDTLFNGTYTVAVVSETGANLGYNVEYANIFLGNFFAPVVTVNTPVDLGSNVFNFTWSAADLNADDVHYYSVWLSGDSGVSYQVLSRNVSDTFFGWDSSGFLERTDYIVRIRAFSVDLTTPVDLGNDLFWPVNVTLSDETYWPGDFADGFSPEFSAGGVPPTTPPPTTTSPTTTPPSTTPPVTGIDPLLIGLIGGIGVGVVILLILFLIRKK